MEFDSIYKNFSDYRLERGNEWGAEYISLSKNGFREPIKVYLVLDISKYLVTFSTQHLHIDEEDELIDAVSGFANASVAAIEFYEKGKNRFGGQIETSLLDHLTYDSLRRRFDYPRLDISQMTFRVYAWDQKYCFEGSFVKSAEKTVQIIKKEMLP